MVSSQLLKMFITLSLNETECHTSPARLKYGCVQRFIGVGLPLTSAVKFNNRELSSVSWKTTETWTFPGKPSSPSSLVRVNVTVSPICLPSHTCWNKNSSNCKYYKIVILSYYQVIDIKFWVLKHIIWSIIIVAVMAFYTGKHTFKWPIVRSKRLAPGVKFVLFMY